MRVAFDLMQKEKASIEVYATENGSVMNIKDGEGNIVCVHLNYVQTNEFVLSVDRNL